MKIVVIGKQEVKIGQKTKKTHKPFTHFRTVYQDVTERARYEASKHLPHNGNKEKARRLRQQKG